MWLGQETTETVWLLELKISGAASSGADFGCRFSCFLAFEWAWLCRDVIAVTDQIFDNLTLYKFIISMGSV